MMEEMMDFIGLTMIILLIGVASAFIIRLLAMTGDGNTKKIDLIVGLYIVNIIVTIFLGFIVGVINSGTPIAAFIALIASPFISLVATPFSFFIYRRMEAHKKRSA